MVCPDPVPVPRRRQGLEQPLGEPQGPGAAGAEQPGVPAPQAAPPVLPQQPRRPAPARPADPGGCRVGGGRGAGDEPRLPLCRVLVGAVQPLEPAGHGRSSPHRRDGVPGAQAACVLGRVQLHAARRGAGSRREFFCQQGWLLLSLVRIPIDNFLLPNRSTASRTCSGARRG